MRFLGAYLNFWMGSVPETMIKSAGWLVTALWLARDVWEVVISNLSLFYAELLALCLGNHGGLRKNVYEYRGTIMATLLLAVVWYYDGERMKEYLGSMNSVWKDV